MEVCLYIYMYVYTYVCMRVGIECISMLNKMKIIFKVWRLANMLMSLYEFSEGS